VSTAPTPSTTFTVRLRRFTASGFHLFAEYGPLGRCVGNVNQLTGGRPGFQWSSLAAEGIVMVPGLTGFKSAEAIMVQALRDEGFTVDVEASPRANNTTCPACDGRLGVDCVRCVGLGYVWPDGGVRRVAAPAPTSGGALGGDSGVIVAQSPDRLN
jgi:hypothetical protein